MYRPKDTNQPSRYNARIWDKEKGEWLGNSDPDTLVYYGFNLVNGEVKSLQLWDYDPEKHALDMSTGAKDRNGVEIYENDLVKYGDSPTFRVHWSESALCWQLVTLDRNLVFGVLAPWQELAEVVGDDHQGEYGEIDGKQ